MEKNKRGAKVPPNIGVVVIDSRSKTHPEWYEECINSIKEQTYPFMKLHIVNNVERKDTIGKVRNMGVVALRDCDWILFVDDDDLIVKEYVEMLARYADDEAVLITTYSTFFHEDGVDIPVRLSPIGMWRTSFLLDTPFREDLTRYEDVEMHQRIKNLNLKKSVIEWNYGYYYRQHDKQNSRIDEYGEIKSGNNSKLIKAQAQASMDKIAKALKEKLDEYATR